MWFCCYCCCLLRVALTVDVDVCCLLRVVVIVIVVVDVCCLLRVAVTVIVVVLLFCSLLLFFVVVFNFRFPGSFTFQLLSIKVMYITAENQTFTCDMEYILCCVLI